MSPDELVVRLADLARGAAGDAPGGPDPAGLQRLERTLEQRPSRRARGWVAAAGGLVAAAGALSAAAWLHARALTFVVIHGRPGSGGYVVAEDEGTAVRFSDDSEVAMTAGSRMRVQHVEARGARLMLEGGGVHVRVQARPQAAWAIDAGPYVVRVTGTEFDLSWKAEEQTLDLALRRGSVTVEGPLADGSIRMVAGQHLVARALEGLVSVGDLEPPSAGAPASVAARAVDPVGAGPGGPPLSAPGGAQGTLPAAGRPVALAAPGWSSRLARGDFQGIVDEARRRGLDSTLAEVPLPDLAALADAARYSRRTDVAQAALGAERKRFAGSAQAHDASFFLAGLAEGSGQDAAALDGYDTYLRESPLGSYASQALGRKLLLVQKLRGLDDARPVASAYLARFRDGPYAEYARKVLQMP